MKLKKNIKGKNLIVVPKFKNGDKVRVINGRTDDKRLLIGTTYTILNCFMSDDEVYYSVWELANGGYVWFQDEIELVEKTFTKADLKPGMVVEYRCGDRRFFVNDLFMSLDYGWSSITEYSDDLLNSNNKELDIIKVYTAHSPVLRDIFKDFTLIHIWERKEAKPYKEMTVAEIEEKLGFKVKVIADKE